MSMKKFSINRICGILGMLLMLSSGTASVMVYLFTGNKNAVWCVVLFSLFVLFCAICFVVLIRCKLVDFSDSFCLLMDEMLSGAKIPRGYR